jgi:type IV pilus assembly protein PilC
MTQMMMPAPVADQDGASPRPMTRPIGRDPWWKQGPRIGRLVKVEDVMNFSRQAASFITSGVPINDALGIVAEECGSRKLAEVLIDVQRRLRTGSTFGDAIAAHPRVFPGYYVAIVRAAELTGHLDEAFEQLANDLQRDLTARRQIKGALTYPLIVMALAVVAVVLMATWVLPKFEGFYTSLHAHLPLPTRMLLWMTDGIAQWWWAIALVLAALVAIGAAVLGGTQGKGRRDTLLLKVPLIGHVLRLIALERFCRMLAALVHAGVPLPDAVQVAGDSTNQRVFQEKLGDVREAMMRGEGLARPIAASGIFPAAARQMIRVGESTGSLDQQLRSAARFYAGELEYRLKKLADSFEPGVVVLVGAAVGFVAIAQISAMYSVYSQVKTR